ncbi:MAG: hypothetical protein GYA36_19920 [Veillonellaceae bacterium]|nr:hypothetical protein [Veillonellaceae bacterium]
MNYKDLLSTSEIGFSIILILLISHSCISPINAQREELQNLKEPTIQEMTVEFGKTEETITRTIVRTPSPAPPSITPTFEPLEKRTPTKAVYPVVTPTVYSTSHITESEIRSYWQKIVTSNADCKLPCFLGLQPGFSDWLDVEKLFSEIDNGNFIRPEPSNGPFPYEFRDICLSECDGHDFVFEFFEQDGTIQRISARTEMIQYRTEVAEVLKSYRIDNVLMQYGTPSKVLIHVKPFPNHKDVEPEYTLNILYPEKGILLHYWGNGVSILGQDNTVARVCPSFDKLIVFTLFLRAENDDTPLEDLTVGTEADITEVLPGLNLSPRPIEKTTNMSISDFYTQFRSPGACFDTPTKIWK